MGMQRYDAYYKSDLGDKLSAMLERSEDGDLVLYADAQERERVTDKTIARFGLSVAAATFLVWCLFCWKFIEIQRWSCTHVMNCGCGQGYKAVYHGLHQKITCSREP